MADAQARQSADAQNASGVGTRFMPPSSHGQYSSSAAVQDGGASDKGKAEPADKVGAA